MTTPTIETLVEITALTREVSNESDMNLINGAMFDTNTPNWSSEYIENWLRKNRWQLSALNWLVEHVLFDDEAPLGALTPETLNRLADKFWGNAAKSYPDVRSLVAMACNNSFTDDAKFYEAGADWIASTHKDTQTLFLWTYWRAGSPNSLNPLVHSLTLHEDYYVRALASTIAAEEKVLAGLEASSDGIHFLRTTYLALTKPEFIIRLKQGKMLSQEFIETIRSISNAVCSSRGFTPKQKLYLPKVLKKHGI